MRQTRGAEHQGEAEAEEVQSAGEALAVLQPGLQVALAGAAVLGRLPHQLGDVAVEAHQQQHRQQHRAGDQQERLDDLDPGGGPHPADRDIDDHQTAHRHDGPGPGLGAVGAEQQGDQAARADHLGDQVEQRDHDAGAAGRGPDLAPAQPQRQHIGQGVPAGVPDQLGDQHQDHQPGHQEADAVEHAVVPEQRDQPGDAEEGGGGEVVAGEREAVLQRREVAAAGVEVVGAAASAAAGPEGDPEGDQDDDGEQHHGQVVVVAGGGHGGRGGGPHRNWSWVSQRSDRAARSRWVRALRA